MKRFIKASKGAISLFLVVILLPFTEIATILISAQRYNSSIAVLEEVMSSSMVSTLSNYDSYIKDRFGLLTLAQKSELQSTFDKYFDYNKNILPSAFNSDLKATVNGALSLDNDEVLLKQIKEYSKLTAPFLMLHNGLDLSEQIKKLEKMLKIDSFLDMANSGADLCDGALEFDDSYEKLQTLSSQIEELKSTYNDKYSTFDSTIKSIQEKKDELEEYKKKVNSNSSSMNALNEEYKELTESNASEEELKAVADKISALMEENEQNESDKEKANAEIVRLLNSFETARDEYANSHTKLISKLTDYCTEMTKALENMKKVIDSTEQTILDVAQSAESVSKNSLKKKNEELEKKLEEYTREDNPKEKDADYYDMVFEIGENNGKISRVNTDNALATGMDETTKELTRLVQESSEAFNADEIQSVIDALTKQKATVEKLSTTDIKDLSGGSKYYTSINVVLAVDKLDILHKYFEDTGDNISTSIKDLWEGLKSFVEASLKLKLVYDPALCAKINTAFFQTDYGIKISLPASNPLAEFIQCLGNVVTGVTDLASGLLTLKFRKMWEAIKKIFVNIGKALWSIGEIVYQLIANVAEVVKDPAMVMFPFYLSQTLPARTDYKTGKNMTGNSFSKIEYVNYGDSGVVGLPVLQDIVSLFSLVSGDKAADDKMFAGAELEYIISGSNNEIENQATVFGMLYVIRLLFDLPIVSKSPEILALATGPQAGIVMFLFYALEPFVDCILLVNGETVSLIKKEPFLSIAGLAELIPKLVKVVSPEDKSNMKLKIAGLFKETDKEAIIEKKYDESKGYGAKLLELNYKEYLYLIMLLFSNSDAEIKALKNLIQMETLAYNTKNQKGDFNLKKAYTQINCIVAGTSNPLLATAFSDSIFKFSRNLCRGY